MEEKLSVTLSTEFIKLNQLLKFAGLVATGGEADLLIKEGFVKVADEVCLLRGKKCRPGDKITVDDGEQKIILTVC